MILRREFMQLGLAVGAGSLLAWPAIAMATAPGGSAVLPLFRVLHDTRVADSLARARALGTQLLGSAAATEPLLQGLHGDVTQFWYAQLQPLWRQQRVALAGSTQPDVLFCLEQLARDHQLRVQWREQQATAEGPVLLSWLITA